jgi:hypothetical protein
MGTPEFRFLIQIFRYHRLDLAYSTVASYAKYSEYLLSSLHSLLVLYTFSGILRGNVKTSSGPTYFTILRSRPNTPHDDQNGGKRIFDRSDFR